MAWVEGERGGGGKGGEGNKIIGGNTCGATALYSISK